MVGASRFERPTSCSQGRRANQAALRPDNHKNVYLVCLVYFVCLVCSRKNNLTEKKAETNLTGISGLNVPKNLNSLKCRCNNLFQLP